jgi:hypothetical protein
VLADIHRLVTVLCPAPLIDYLRFYVPLKNISLTITGEAQENLGLCSALRACEQGGIFIVQHLL